MFGLLGIAGIFITQCKFKKASIQNYGFKTTNK
ncbi:hypothetical protein [uncultured Nostoc sp.]